MYDFTNVDPVKCCTWLVLPTVYDESLSYGEQLNKFCKALNELIENNNNLPDYVAEMIQSYITSGAIDEVVRNVLANYILNVKYPPKGITPAVGDGSADDTDAIQGCIDYAFNQGGGCVYFPYGKYLSRSLTLRSGVSLVGFDRYSTRIVQRGGDTKPLVSGGNIQNVQISNLTLDGNNEVQADDLDVIYILGSDILLSNLIVKSGYQCLNYIGNKGTLQVDNVDFGSAVKKIVFVDGTGVTQFTNVTFNSIGKVESECIIDVNGSNGVYNFISTAEAPLCIKCSGNNNYFNATIINSPTYIDAGNFNTFNIHGKEEKQQLSTGKYTRVNGNVISDIYGNYTENIKTDKNENIEHNRELDINGSDSVHIDGASTVNVGGIRSEVYASDYSIDITGNKIEKANNSTENITGVKNVNTNTYNVIAETEAKIKSDSLVLDSNGNPIKLGVNVNDELYFGKLPVIMANGTTRNILFENNGTTNLENKSNYDCKNVVILGDSFAGNWFSNYQSYAYLLKNLLNIKTLHVYSLGGAGFLGKGTLAPYSNVTFQEYLDAAFSSEMSSYANDVTMVIIQGGGNDYKQNYEAEATAVKNLVNDIKTKFPNAKIYGVSGFWLHNMYSDTKNGIIKGFNETGTPLFPHCFYTFINHSEYFNEDKLHPNKTGMEIMANAIANNILYGATYDCNQGGFISANGGGFVWQITNDGLLRGYVSTTASTVICDIPKTIQPAEIDVFGTGYSATGTGELASLWYNNQQLRVYLPGKTSTGTFRGSISWFVNANDVNDKG
nr:MAG TPA_asm: hydrolase [Caudoviricetes sp.]